ncbi:hypothetical protein F8388_005382 (mitochondrion) [Cannabis sativa]|uniref:Small ribosomal subunit protein uS7 domain-containing protein n=1 Tax=Cannabis sativa TaxID=3483 RepID=A0A7J6DRA7_CANSA|nr:hypothetical protein F8388_005382 [Cannabis sativa]KAF4357860.1 hypothetical protein G4B88_003594 [Cannabis sativa]
MGGLDGEQKQLIKKLVNFRMKEGKRTRVRAIVYQTFHRPAQTERDVIKLMVDAVENIQPICEVEKVGVAGTIYDVPGIVARDRQQTLAIRWILEAAFKRRISYRISLEKCSFAEILDAYRKRGIAHWLPPIEGSRISDGGKVKPHKELFLIQSDYSNKFLILLPSFIELEESIGGPPVMHCMKEPFFVEWGDQSKKWAMNEEVVAFHPLSSDSGSGSDKCASKGGKLGFPCWYGRA